MNCHVDPTFQGQDPACVSCHLQDEPHEGQFGTDCALCHTTLIWEEIVFDHSNPGFEDCTSCHLPDSPVPHYPGQCSACHQVNGWLPASFDHAVARARDCLGCHKPDLPNNHYGGQCSICHTTDAWKPAYFNHTFPVNHEGANNRCELCHSSTNYSSYTCYNCHEHSRSNVLEEHGNISNLNDCIRCHWDGREHGD